MRKGKEEPVARIRRGRVGDARALVALYAREPAVSDFDSLHTTAQIRRPVYDAFYLVLARRHDGCLLTLDQGLKAVARKSAVRVSPA
jgi:predicted nucleic acid-binding protein